jgi:signal transduction histidine kinase
MQDQHETKGSADPHASVLDRQLAVERVRGAAMAMHATSDLRQVVALLFREMRRLGIQTPGASITFVDEEKGTGTRYVAFVDPEHLGFARDDPADRFVLLDDVVATVMFTKPLQDLPDIALTWQTGKPQTYQHHAGGSGVEADFYVSAFGTTQEAADQLVTEIWQGDWAVSQVPFRFGVIMYRQREHHAEDDTIVAELAQGLELGFVRFLDFHKIEDQNRELTIQNALERVRSQALGMQSSDELRDVTSVLFEQFRGLGHEVHSSFIYVQDGGAWSQDRTGRQRHSPDSRPAGLEHPEPLRLREQNRAQEMGQPWFVFQRQGVDLRRLIGYYLECDSVPAHEIEGELRQLPDSLIFHRVFHATGVVEFALENHLCDADLAVAKRFTDVFDIAYRRFRELQLKEAHNRELEVDRALERVRADVASMAHSRDLSRIVEMAQESLKGLGVPCTILGIDTIDEAAGIWRHHEYDGATDYPLSVSTAAKWYEEWQTGQTLHKRWPRAEITRDMQALFDAGLIELGNRWRGVLTELESGLWSASVPFAQGNVGMFKPDGDGPFADDHIRLLERFAGVVALAYTRFVDFQRLEEQNAQIQQASLNKSQFLRRMSHDLRSPMNAIIGYTRLLQRRLADRMDEREARNLANIETSSGNLLNLINDILDLSRIEAGRIEVNSRDFDPCALANECADSLESIVKEGVTLIRDLAAVGQISSDVDRLRQVVMNLLGNATKFTEAGSITLSLKRDGDCIELSVADTGIGIPADDLPHIFDEFRQVERQGGAGAEGTGLGLAIAKKTVDLLGGEIAATSQGSAGTTFTVRLPV